MSRVLSILILLICSSGLVLSAPRITSESDATANTAGTNSNKGVFSENDVLNSEEIFKLYPDPNDFRAEKMSTDQVAVYNDSAKSMGLSLDEFLFFGRIGLRSKKLEKEGKDKVEAMNQEATCTELLSIPRNPDKPSVDTDSAKMVLQLRLICELTKISENPAS